MSISDAQPSPEKTEKAYSTYIEGFDGSLDGGIPQGHIVLVSGAPGTMKSTLAFSILYNNAKEELASGLYITLEQTRESLMRQMEKLGMFVGREFGVEILDLSVFRQGEEDWMGDSGEDGRRETAWFKKFRNILETQKKVVDYDLMVIDSLPLLEIVCGIRNSRYGLFRLFNWLRDMGTTTFIISENPPDEKIVRESDFMVDGIFHLLMETSAELNQSRVLRCAKMREVNHDPGYYVLEYKDRRFWATPKRYDVGRMVSHL